MPLTLSFLLPLRPESRHQTATASDFIRRSIVLVLDISGAKGKTRVMSPKKTSFSEVTKETHLNMTKMFCAKVAKHAKKGYYPV
jgi:hypothetical protein